MKTKVTVSLAILLLATASTAALAQDRDHERGSGQAAHPQGSRPGGPGPGGGHGNGAPQGGPPHSGPQGFPQGSRNGPSSAQGGEHGSYQGQMGDRQSHQAQGPVNGARGQHAGPGPGAGRQFDGERSLAARGPGVGGPVGSRNNPWGGPGQHWQPGHAPQVFWSHDRFHLGNYNPPYGYYVRSWGFGDFLPRGWYGQSYWIGDYLNYGLPYPPPGFQWVRVGGDALMIERFSGRIVQVVRGIFW